MTTVILKHVILTLENALNYQKDAHMAKVLQKLIQLVNMNSKLNVLKYGELKTSENYI